MKRMLLAICIAVATTASFAQAPTAKQAFEEIKKLAGTWEMKQGDAKLNVIYKVSGAGSAVFETQFPGQATEMVSVYHMDGDKLVMTHYCAAGNQPTLIYKPGKDLKTLEFEFLRGSNMKPTDMHIHAAVLKFMGAGHLVSDWTGYMDGKNAGTTTFDLKRVQ